MNLIETTTAADIIRRTFNGSVEQILGELFQNSQRAEANAVSITTQDDLIIYEDNGCGLKAVSDFEQLVWIGRSGWDRHVTTNQRPYGVGFYAILAHEGVTQVSITSCDKRLTINTSLWWSDPEYSQNWLQLLSSESMVAGVKIEITTRRSWWAKIQELLPTDVKSYRSSIIASGYSNYFSLKVNNLPVVLKNWRGQGKVLSETLYMGNCLTIYQDKNYNSSFSRINHYGQIVRFSDSLGHVSFALAITTGNPVDLKSPAREGLITNEKLTALKLFVLTQAINYLSDPTTDPSTVEPEFLESMYEYHSDLLNNCQFYLASAPKAISTNWINCCGNLEEYEWNYDCKPLVLKYSDLTQQSYQLINADEIGRAHV